MKLEKTEAIISSCKRYRYSLTRIWDSNKNTMLFIMLNPSTANEKEDDTTVRRCIGFANTFGYGGIHIVNLFAFRAKNPNDLLIESNPVGIDNEMWIKTRASQSEIVVCAWGNEHILKRLKPDIKALNSLNRELYCLKLSKNGIPCHPSRLSYNLNLKKL